MNVRFENIEKFYISGYTMKTSEGTLEKDCAEIREKYEATLRTVSDDLYFIATMSEGIMVYHFGVKVPTLEPVTDEATCVEVPASRFAVATVLEGEPILATWYKFFELFGKNDALLNGAEIDLDYPANFEFFAKNGTCELGIPVKV